MTQIEKVYGEDIKKIIENNLCSIYKIENESGEGLITIYKIFQGIEVCYNDMHIEYVKQEKQTYNNIVEINHCREGRFESILENGTFTYFEPGDLAINCHKNCMIKSEFPIRHYHGISILFYMDELSDDVLQLFEDMGTKLKDIVNSLCPSGKLFIMRSTESIQHIFSELYTVPDQIRISYLKLKVMELLLFLTTVKLEAGYNDKPYYLKSQVNSIKQIHSFMVEHLDKHYTHDKLSSLFSIPLSVMKQCFKEVYGKSIYAYMKSYRLKEGARLIKETNFSVTEIAHMIGYENTGKFSTAFKKEMNILPSEYRKKIIGLENKKRIGEE